MRHFEFDKERGMQVTRTKNLSQLVSNDDRNKSSNTSLQRESLIMRIIHTLNPLHMYCRGRDLGLSMSTSMYLSRKYERVIFPFISKPIELYYWVKNSVVGNGNNGRARLY